MKIHREKRRIRVLSWISIIIVNLSNTFRKSHSIRPENALLRCGFSRSPTSYLLPRPRDPIGRSRRFDRLRQNLPTWKF